MSKKSEKKNRQQKSSNNDTVNEQMTYINKDQIFDYLRKIMSRYSGYPFISVSKSFKDGKYDAVLIVVHRNMPVQDKNGRYHSDQDQYVRTIYIENTEFEGMIMDRQKNYAFGNPFKHHFEETKDEKAPELGKQEKPFKPEEEVAEPL